MVHRQAEARRSSLSTWVRLTRGLISGWRRDCAGGSWLVRLRRAGRTVADDAQPGVRTRVRRAAGPCGCPREPDHAELDCGHGRIIRRSIWVADAESIDSRTSAGRPDPPRPLRRRRLADQQGNRARRHQPRHGAGQCRRPREDCPRPVGHRVRAWLRDTAYAEDASTGYAGNGPQIMGTLRNLAISLLYLTGVKESPLLSRPSHATAPACSTTCRYEMRSQTTLPIPWPVIGGFPRGLWSGRLRLSGKTRSPKSCR